MGGEFQKYMLSMTLLLGQLEEMMISRRKRKCSLINIAFAATAHVAGTFDIDKNTLTQKIDTT